MSQESHPGRSELKRLLRTLNKGLKSLKPEDLFSRTACPDSWTLASYVTGELDEEERRAIHAHIAFCDSCFDEFVALAGPEQIAKLLNKESSLEVELDVEPRRE